MTIAAMAVVAAAMLASACSGDGGAGASASTASRCRDERFLVTPPDRGRLRDVVVAAGTSVHEHQMEVRVAGSPPTGSLDVVTGVSVAAGGQVVSGMIVAHIAGRPVVAVDSPVPAYRDILLGTVGEDVSHVQAMLTAAGFGVHPDPLGTAEYGTARALQRFAASRGEASSIVLPADDAPPAPVVLLPLSEYVTLPQLPGTVVDLGAGVGDRVSTSERPLMTVGSGAVLLRLPVPSARATSVIPGQGVDLLDGQERSVGTGTVDSVAPSDVDAGDGLMVRSVTIRPSAPIGPGKYVARIVVADAGIEGVVVPSAAVHRSDVESRSISVTTAPAGVSCGMPRSRRVEVEVVASIDGQAQLGGTPIPAGQRIVVPSS